MKLQLTHKDLELALVQYLEKQGITAFSNLEKVHATFSKVRGSDELTVELDNDYTPPPAKPVEEAKPKAAAGASATKGGENDVPEAKPDAEAKEEAKTEAESAKADAVDTQAAETKAPTASAEAEDLFN